MQRLSPLKPKLMDCFVSPRRTPLPRNLKHHAFNDYFKLRPNDFVSNSKSATLDKYLLLDVSKVHEASELVQIDLSNSRIARVIEIDLALFHNLAIIDLSGNDVKIEQLFNLENLCSLNLMCNKIQNIPLLSEKFRLLESLNLSYNYLTTSSLSNLSDLPKLKSLDLSANNLTELPEDMSAFKSLRELSLNSNSFINKDALFYALNTIPKLTKVSVAKNRFRKIYSEKLDNNPFAHLKEIDFSYNLVQKETDLEFAVNFKNLQVLNLTGNPLKKTPEFLESLLSSQLGATVIFKKKMIKLPYPKPIATIEDFPLKNSLLDIENLKGMRTVHMSAVSSTQEDEDEVFPRYSPSIYKLSTSTERDDSFFVTETKQFTHSKMNQFKDLAYNLLGGNKTHRKKYNIQVAYKQLKYIMQHPTVIRQPRAPTKKLYFNPSVMESQESDIQMFNIETHKSYKTRSV